MALTPPERKRRQVERARDHAKRQLDLTYDLPRTPFGEWIQEHCDGDELLHLGICFDGMNRQPPDFSDDHDPVSETGYFKFPTTDAGTPSYLGSLGRAEIEVDLLIEAAKTLATMINAYKRSVIKGRISHIEQHELAKPETRAAALSEGFELSKALERLEKTVRAEVPQWQLRG